MRLPDLETSVLGPLVRRWLIRAAIAGAALYFLAALLLFCFQDMMIYPGALLPAGDRATLPDGVQQVWLRAPDGTAVEGWFQTGRGRSAAAPGPAAMFFHGNGDLIDTRWAAQRALLEAGVSVLAVEYRGYGRVGGRPSQAAIVADAVMFHDWLAGRAEVDAAAILLRGQSLGGAVAAALAARRPPAALVLEATFTSMEAMANRYLMPGFLCRDAFRTDRVLRALNCPILIMHGRRDGTIPVSHGRALHALAPGSRYVEQDLGHNDWVTDWGEILAFLRDSGLLPE